jgi:hypothetical protein
MNVVGNKICKKNFPTGPPTKKWNCCTCDTA